MKRETHVLLGANQKQMVNKPSLWLEASIQGIQGTRREEEAIKEQSHVENGCCGSWWVTWCRLYRRRNPSMHRCYQCSRQPHTHQA